MMSALKGALVSLADGGASQMIKEAIQNLELKLKIKTSKSKRHENILNSENNKNEIRFKGGDTTVDPEQIGGSQFAIWKDSIGNSPAAIEKTLSPITELILAFAGPNPGEQCPSKEVHKKIEHVAQMVECMTNKILRESRDLSDTIYEMSQIETKKARVARELDKMNLQCGEKDSKDKTCVSALKKITIDWQELCKMKKKSFNFFSIIFSSLSLYPTHSHPHLLLSRYAKDEFACKT